MSLYFAKPDDVVLHYHWQTGDGTRPVVFLNSLGTDFRIWNGVVQALGPVPMLMIDKRGHGLSDAGPIDIETLADDAAALMDMLGLRGALVCGVSVGGMIAQSLASRRPDLVAGLLLSNTGARIGEGAFWNKRIADVRTKGLEAMSDSILERWFAPQFRHAHPQALSGYRNMLMRTPANGYAAVCAAIRNADLSDQTAQLRVPTLCVGGTDDQSTPPDLVRHLANLIPDAMCEILPGVGHLPCIEMPKQIAAYLQTLRDGLQ